MKRPDKERVKDAIRRDGMSGKKMYIEAVELDSGLMILEYECRSHPITISEHHEIHVTRRVVIQDPNRQLHTSLISESWFE